MSWIACLLTLIGLALNARRNIWCWPIWLVASMLWVIYGGITGQYSVVLTNSVMWMMNWIGWKAWLVEREKP